MPTTQIPNLLMQRRIPLERLKEIYDYAINKTDEENYRFNFFARAEFVGTLYEEFCELHNKVIALVDTEKEFNIQDQKRKETDLYLYNIRSIKAKLLSTQSLTSTNELLAGNPIHNSNIKLPKINVPEFEGSLDSWPTFFDIFNQLIHLNTSLSNIEKFRYLITSLKGEPLALLKNIIITEANYQIAYDKIVKRYQNRRYLATNYFNAMYSAAPSKPGCYKSLRILLDTFSENLLALNSLNFDTQSWDFIMFNILLQKVDEEMRMSFEIEFSKIDMPSYENLHAFLTERCSGLESTKSMVPKSHFNKGKNTDSKTKTSSTLISTLSNNVNCVICSEGHRIFQCPTFISKTPNERLTSVKQKQLCVNCLRSGHRIKDYISSYCRVCGKPHNSLLHFPNAVSNASHSNTTSLRQNSNQNRLENPLYNSSNNSTRNQAPGTSVNNPAVNEQNSGHTLQNLHVNAYVSASNLLSTALVEIRDKNGEYQKVRVLLDTASMANFITENCIQKLGLPRRHASTHIEGIDNFASISNNGKTDCMIKPIGQEVPQFKFEAVILPKICSQQPKLNLKSLNLDYIKNLKLADPSFSIPGNVDILLGAELFPYVIKAGKIFGQPGSPIALETIFGWILQGRVQLSSSVDSYFTCLSTSVNNLDDLLEKFWETENIPDLVSPVSKDDRVCETKFIETVSRDLTGRFSVQLPFKFESVYFGDILSSVDEIS